MASNIQKIVTILLTFGYYAHANDCPDNWMVYGNSCYLFGHQSLSFFSAESYCSQHKGHLVHVNDNAENIFIREHLRYMKDSAWWIGLTDDDVENTWIWYGTNERAEYTDWAPAQPDDHLKNEDCVAFDLDPAFNAHWNDAPCETHLPPICERPFDVPNNIVG